MHFNYAEEFWTRRTHKIGTCNSQDVTVAWGTQLWSGKKWEKAIMNLVTWLLESFFSSRLHAMDWGFEPWRPAREFSCLRQSRRGSNCGFHTLSWAVYRSIFRMDTISIYDCRCKVVNVIVNEPSWASHWHAYYWHKTANIKNVDKTYYGT